MPYAHGPSVKKLSKMATLLLARNYIILLNRSVEEMRRMLADVYRQQIGVPGPLHGTTLSTSALSGTIPPSTPTAIHPSVIPQHDRLRPDSTQPKSLHSSTREDKKLTPTSIPSSLPTTLSPPSLPMSSLPSHIPSYHPASSLLLPPIHPSLHGMNYHHPLHPLPSMFPSGLPSSEHLLHASLSPHTGSDSCTCAYCRAGLKHDALFKV